MRFTDDVLVCGGVDVNKRPLLTCDILKRKSYWEFDVSKLEESRTNAATAPSPYKDWFVTGGFVGVYNFIFWIFKDWFIKNRTEFDSVIQLCLVRFLMNQSL